MENGGKFIFDIPNREKGGYKKMVDGYAEEMEKHGIHNFRRGSFMIRRTERISPPATPIPRKTSRNWRASPDSGSPKSKNGSWKPDRAMRICIMFWKIYEISQRSSQ